MTPTVTLTPTVVECGAVRIRAVFEVAVGCLLPFVGFRPLTLPVVAALVSGPAYLAARFGVPAAAPPTACGTLEHGVIVAVLLSLLLGALAVCSVLAYMHCSAVVQERDWGCWGRRACRVGTGLVCVAASTAGCGWLVIGAHAAFLATIAPWKLWVAVGIGAGASSVLATLSHLCNADDDRPTKHNQQQLSNVEGV